MIFYTTPLQRGGGDLMGAGLLHTANFQTKNL